MEASVECNISPEEREDRKALVKVGKNFHHYRLHGVWPKGVDLREAEFYLATSIWPKYLAPEAPKKGAGEKKVINYQELSKDLLPFLLPETPKNASRRETIKHIKKHRPLIRRSMRPSARVTDKSQPMRPPTAKRMNLGLCRTVPLFQR